LESTKARIQGIVQKMFEAVITVIPVESGVQPLGEEEEVEGMFCLFFTSKGSRGCAVGVLDSTEVLDYLDEVEAARFVAIRNGKSIVDSSDIDLVKKMREYK